MTNWEELIAALDELGIDYRIWHEDIDDKRSIEIYHQEIDLR